MSQALKTRAAAFSAPHPFLGLVLLLGLMFLGVGCSSLRRTAVPHPLTRAAVIPGFPGIRIPMDATEIKAGEVDAWLAPVVRRARGGHGPVTLLALSGGGPDGAYGAGLMNGWTQAGNRPEFDMVTGISTGSLIAPFAFLGPAYDPTLRQAYLTISDGRVFRKRSFLGLLFNGISVADSDPLYETILGQFDDQVLAAIAAEHRKGRRLYVGTTDMDAEALMCWDMGAIAASGSPGARELFCRVLLASASIPVAFPPVFFDVEAGGRSYQEMHCDGGCMTQVFGFVFLSRVRELSGRSAATLYVVRNEILSATWEDVRPELVPIGARAINLLLRNQGVGDLYRAYLVSLETGLDFQLSYIPDGFSYSNRHGQFDPGYMKALYDLGFDRAVSGEAWTRSAPGTHLLREGSSHP